MHKLELKEDYGISDLKTKIKLDAYTTRAERRS